METFTIIISKDGEVKKTFTGEKNDFAAFAWLLRNQGQSTSWAVKYGGWKVEIINEQTGEKDYYKPY